MSKRSLLTSALIIISAVGFYIVTSTKAPASEPGELATLFCSTSESAQNIVDSIEEGGNDAALKTAEELVRSGDCKYEISILWWNQGKAPEGYEPYEEVECVQYSSGICLGIQPAYTSEGPGYLLVASGEIDESLTHLISN